MALQEEIIFEGRPHVADLIANTLLLVTVFWFPFWVGAVLNYAFTRYRITNRRISVEGGWRGETRTDIIYREVNEVREIPATVVGSLFGYGILLILLKDGSKLELKSVPKFRELGAYIREKSEQYQDKKPKSATKS